jgi:hypothetical protein
MTLGSAFRTVAFVLIRTISPNKRVTHLQDISLSRLGRASVTSGVYAMVPSFNTPGQI